MVLFAFLKGQSRANKSGLFKKGFNNDREA